MAADANVSKTLLRSVPLLAMLPERQLDALTTVMKRQNFPRGASVIKAGDVTDSLYIVLSGRLKVVNSSESGREVILAMVGPSEYFGEMVPLDDMPRSASVITVVPSEVLMLSRHEFRKCLSENFEMTMMVIRGLVLRMSEADRKIGSLALMDVHGRVAGQLLEMSERIEGQQVVTNKVSYHDMAKMVGASREMVSRVMKNLRAEGFVEKRGTSIYLHDRTALERRLRA